MMDSAPDSLVPDNSQRVASNMLRRTGGNSNASRISIDVMESLRHHWVVALVVFVTVAGCGGLLLQRKVKPVYESQSVVYLSPKFPKMLAGDSEVELPYDSYVQDQIQTVTRHDIIADAIEKLPTDIRKVTGPALPYEIQVMQHMLEVKRVGSTYEMSISMYGPTAQGLAETVNTITQTYVDRMKSEEFYGLNDRLATLRAERERLQKEMEDSMAEQAQLMQSLGVASISTKEGATNPYDASLLQLRGEQANARMQRLAAEAQLAAAQKNSDKSVGQSTVTDSIAEDAVASDSGVSGMRNALNSRKAALLGEMIGLRTDHPVYQKDKEELDSIATQMDELKKRAGDNVLDKLRREVARTRTIELQLTQELAMKTHSAVSAAPKFQKATALIPQIEDLQKAYDAISGRIRDLELESSSPGSIHVSTMAMTPLGPEKSKLKIYILALFVMSVLLATSTAVAIDLMDGRIYSAADVERVVGFHPIGVLLDEDQFQREISGEYYLRLAAGIDHAVRNSGARVFLFTSLAHGCGTSAIVRKVSDKLRSLDLRVRTIGASSINEPAATGSELASRPGLIVPKKDLMDDLSTIPSSQMLVMTDHNVHGGRQDSPAPNTTMRTLRQVSEDYDIVLIDASPLPISAQAEYLARVADASIVVVQSASSTKQQLDRAARLLERLNVAGVAVVLNRVRMERVDRAMRNELKTYQESLGKPKPAPTPEAEVREKISA